MPGTRGCGCRVLTSLPRHVSERPARWPATNALYRALLRLDSTAADAAATALVRRARPVLVRVGIALTAEHDDHVGPLDEILMNADRWDRSDARPEFRLVVRDRLADASTTGLVALLVYAERAQEVRVLLDRLSVVLNEVDRDLQVRRSAHPTPWRVWNAVPPEWQARLGALVEGEPLFEEVQEPKAHFVPDSSYSKEELGALEPLDSFTAFRIALRQASTRSRHAAD